MIPRPQTSNKDKIKSFVKVAFGGSVVFGGVGFYQGNEKFYEDFVMPIVRLIDPEVAHNLAILAAKWGLTPVQKAQDPELIQQKLWNLKFKNPVGIAAGFDKNGEAIQGLSKMGFGFVEIGSVTPNPQPGNPKPRVFRLLADSAVINRYGFNSDGHEVVWNRLKKLKENPEFKGIVGVNLGKNKTSEDSIQDYVDGIKKFSELADYLVINVSSPNTAGLRDLQNKENLEGLLTTINTVRLSMNKQPPLLLKLAPDLTADERQDIADIIKKDKSKVDGLILTNTTISRNNLTDNQQNEIGGLSGKPLTDLSTVMIADMYKRTRGKVPIIGVGGIFTGQDAYDKISAGASLIQIYTSFAYHGPPIISKIKRELNDILLSNGHTFIDSAVGKKK